MNEPSSFVDGSASNSTMSLENTTVVPRMCSRDPDVDEEANYRRAADYSTVPFPTSWPEGYSNVTGISGNVVSCHATHQRRFR